MDLNFDHLHNSHHKVSSVSNDFIRMAMHDENGYTSPNRNNGYVLRDYGSFIGDSPVFEANRLSSHYLPSFSLVELVRK